MPLVEDMSLGGPCLPGWRMPGSDQPSMDFQLTLQTTSSLFLGLAPMPGCKNSFLKHVDWLLACLVFQHVATNGWVARSL